MNKWHDIVDWVGGYPYEFATPDQIFDFYKARGFALTKMKCGGVGLGCNEFVFERRVTNPDVWRTQTPVRALKRANPPRLVRDSQAHRSLKTPVAAVSSQRRRRGRQSRLGQRTC